MYILQKPKRFTKYNNVYSFYYINNNTCGRRKYKKKIKISGDRDEWRRRLGVKIITFQRYFSKQIVCILLYFYIFLVTVGFIRRTAHVFSITSTHTHTHNTYMNVHFYFLLYIHTHNVFRITRYP